ncbi:hypothetical protein PTTG_27902 [Puccinia triticina 1-1 BBBD Race 1]|uniref:Uncharacterized protein n=2 Tax=Puccinia triticina TaxID=208348 RepID=A0A180GG34_PUCT1|nr:hypothetical protein PTTG_27902 [Puccinia triticina 1-1 BBBD Race 1]
MQTTPGGAGADGRASHSSSGSSGSSEPADEPHPLRDIERFLLDQLPPFLALATTALNRILLNLFYSLKLCHSDLILLINKARTIR